MVRGAAIRRGRGFVLPDRAAGGAFDLRGILALFSSIWIGLSELFTATWAIERGVVMVVGAIDLLRAGWWW
jgi:hypothetical protein